MNKILLKKLNICLCFTLIFLCGFLFFGCNNASNNNYNNANIEQPNNEQQKDIDKNLNDEQVNNMVIYIWVDNKKIELELVNNNATKELLQKLEDEDIFVSMQKNGNFEQYGDLGFNLTSNDISLTAECGDVFLYNSRYICLFYNESTWQYTKLGKIKNMSNEQLTNLLSNKNITIKLSLK